MDKLAFMNGMITIMHLGLKLFNMMKAISRNTKIMFVSALDMAEELISILPDIKHIISSKSQ
jgi:hypothetical protein